LSGNSEAKITLSGVCKGFEDNEVLRGVDLQVNQGKSLVLFGTSGSGKSLLLKCILGLVPIDSGRIEVNGVNPAELSDRERQVFVDRFGMLFQYGGLFDSLRVWENITFKLRQAGEIGSAEARELAEEKLVAVGLGRDVATLFPAELSGGMQKRVGLARAIVGNPEIVFLDEPTAGLDPILSNMINALIVDLVQKPTVTVLAITSDMNSARQISDRMAMLHDGKIIWDGPTSELDTCGNPYVHQFVNKLGEGPIQTVVESAELGAA